LGGPPFQAATIVFLIPLTLLRRTHDCRTSAWCAT